MSAENQSNQTNQTAPQAAKAEHVPVFLNEVLESFRAAETPILNAFDGTFGRGGHATAVLNLYPEAKMVAFDWDEDAIRFGQDKYADLIAADRLKMIRSSYLDFAKVKASTEGFPQKFDCMLLDLGVSSPQLDQADRGFSFYNDGPLDMRMDRRGEITAATIVNEWDEQDLARLFIEYGEVQRPFRIARAIVQDRKEKKPFETTRELATMIERVDGWQKKSSHPATRYFLALRMKVNEELSSLTTAIPDLIESLSEGGVLAIITFHSLEDRIIKNLFKDNLHRGRLVNKKVIKPSDEEVRINPRSRSAKLRAYIKGLKEEESKWKK